MSTDLLGAGDKLALVRFFAALGRARPRQLSGISLRDWLDGKIRRPRLRRLMDSIAYPLVYTSALDLVSAEVFVGKFQRALKHPVHYIDGGWQILVDGLRDVAVRAGARVIGDACVEAVEVGNGRARGVRLRDGGLVRASAVVLATRSRDASKLVGVGEHPALRRAVDGLVPGRVACLDVVLGRLPSPDVPVVQDLDGPRFMTAQSVYSRVAPEGAGRVYTFKQLDPRNPGDPARTSATSRPCSTRPSRAGARSWSIASTWRASKPWARCRPPLGAASRAVPVPGCRVWRTSISRGTGWDRRASWWTPARPAPGAPRCWCWKKIRRRGGRWPPVPYASDPRPKASSYGQDQSMKCNYRFAQ